MTEVHVRAAFRNPLKVRDSGPEGCLSLIASNGDDTFVLQDDKLRLVEVQAAGITTRSGLAVGMPFEQVRKTLGGELEIGANFRDDATVQAIVWEADRRHGVLFEAQDGPVTAMSAGDKALEWVEGCGV